MTQLLSALSVGSKLKFKVGGVDREFLIIHQGKPSSIYDDSCDGTWILMKDIYAKRLWKSGDNNDYATSGIHAYLNSTFPGLIETNVRNAIKQVKIPFRPGAGTSSIVYSGSSGLSSKVFLLSNYEVGLTKSDHTYSVIDGERVSYFDAGTTPIAKTGRIAKFDGVADSWWLRSPVTTGESAVWHILNDGATSSSVTSTQLGMRPAMVLPQNLLVSDLPDENGAYSLIWEVSVNLRTTSIGTATNDTVLTTNSPTISLDGFSGGADDALDILKMLPQFFDPFKALDLRLNLPKISKATIKGAVDDSTTVITGKTDKSLKVGDKLWTGIENEILDLEGNFAEHVVEDVTVINSAYSTRGNGGRKLVRLDNGWLVAGALETNTALIHMYVSKDDGGSWQEICKCHGYNPGDFAMVSRGTFVYVISTSTTYIHFSKFDATIVTNTTQPSVEIETGQTSLDGCSLAINLQGTELHACWSSKNSTYPSSFNIRYAKGTINQDGSVTWGTVEQVTSHNTSNISNTEPSIVVLENGIPIIVHVYKTGTTPSYYIRQQIRDSTWSSPGGSVYEGGTYSQSSPLAVYVTQSINGLPNGRIWVVWHGTDSAQPTNGNIRVRCSDDGGVTWSSFQKLINWANGSLRATISVNKHGDIFIVFETRNQTDANTQELYCIKNPSGVWGQWEQPQLILSNTGSAANLYPSSLFDPSMDTQLPPFIYTNSKESKVGFYGTWTIGEGYTLEMQHPCTLADGQQVPIIDLQVRQRNTEIPLHSIEANRLNYRLDISDVVVDLNIEGKETEVSSLVYAIS